MNMGGRIKNRLDEVGMESGSADRARSRYRSIGQAYAVGPVQSHQAGFGALRRWIR